MSTKEINEIMSINFRNFTKESCIIDDTVVIGKNVTIFPGNVLLGNTIIEDDVTLLPNNCIISSKISKGATILNSVIEESEVGENVKIGPFSHLRPNSKIGQNVRIGNFVEVKNSTIDQNTKVSHLTYVGDADVGKDVNVGCGVVFVNYNGKTKSRSKVGDHSFVGSSVNVIAPVTIGEKSFVCAGTTVDKNVEAGAFVIGRSKMCVKPDRAKKYLK